MITQSFVSSVSAFESCPEILFLMQKIMGNFDIPIGDRPRVAPIEWNGLALSIEKAREWIREMEQVKQIVQNDMNWYHTAGEWIQLILQALAGLAIVTGVVLTVFPPTALAGVAVSAAGAGVYAIGGAVGPAIQQIGTNDRVAKVNQIDAFINSLMKAIIDTI